MSRSYARRHSGALIALSIVTAALVGAGAPAAAQQVWKMQTMWPAGQLPQQAIERFAANVEAATGGELRIEVMPVGTVVGYSETLEAVAAGILDAQQSSGVYFAGKEPALQPCTELNGAFDSPWQMQMWFEYGGGLELCREAYAKFDVFYVGPVWVGHESMPAKKPLRSLEDFKGIKLRAPEGLGAMIWRKVGASVVTLPGSEVYTALEQGVIDAADWSTLAVNDQLGFHKIAPYVLYPGFHSMTGGDFVVNRARWEELSESTRRIVELAVRDLARDMVETAEIADRKTAVRLRAEGVELIDWPPEERAKFRQVAMAAWEEWAQKSEMAGKIISSQIAFLKDIGVLD